MRLPRFTASQEAPVEAKATTPGWRVSTTGASVVGAAPRSRPTSTRPFSEYSRPGMRASVVLRVKRAGSSQTRYVPVGPVRVPRSASPAGSSMVGQPLAGVTRVGVVGVVGAGEGAAAGGLLIVMLPPLLGDSTDSAPQAASAAQALSRGIRRSRFERAMSRSHPAGPEIDAGSVAAAEPQWGSPRGPTSVGTVCDGAVTRG